MCLHYSFGTIRRHIWLLKIFAYAKIDSRLQDARGDPLLAALHIATASHVAASASPVNAAVHEAIRANAAAEIGGITVDVRRVNKAAIICS